LGGFRPVNIHTAVGYKFGQKTCRDELNPEKEKKDSAHKKRLPSLNVMKSALNPQINNICVD
jgi:hypothetical protein